MKDPGTDLLNKRAITDYVRKLIDSQPGHTVTIAIIDVDDFKTCSWKQRIVWKNWRR